MALLTLGSAWPFWKLPKRRRTDRTGPSGSPGVPAKVYIVVTEPELSWTLLSMASTRSATVRPQSGSRRWPVAGSLGLGVPGGTLSLSVFSGPVDCSASWLSGPGWPPRESRLDFRSGLESSPELWRFCGANLVPSAKETDGRLARARLEVRGIVNGVEASSGGGKGPSTRLASGDSAWATRTIPSLGGTQ